MDKIVPVLDRGWVELGQTLPSWDTVPADRVVVNAARTSFLGESKGDEQDAKLIRYLMRNRHTSPFEMVEMTFRIHAPLVVWWQLVRHRTANLSLQSGRYVPFEENEFYVPSEWRKQSQSNKQASDGVIDNDTNTDLIDSLVLHYQTSYDLYQDALQKGVAREMARLFLPAFGVYYTGWFKMDVHNLMHMLSLRLKSDAQYEIRVYAEAIYGFFKEFMPVTAEAFDTYLLKKGE